MWKKSGSHCRNFFKNQISLKKLQAITEKGKYDEV